jgi:hypothetical protein
MVTFKSLYSFFHKGNKTLDGSMLLKLFGHSIYHPEIDKALKDFNIVVTDKVKLERYVTLESMTSGVIFGFWFKEFYELQIRKAQSILRPKDEIEVLLYEMTFRPIKGVNLILPFGLTFGNSAQEVISKLGQKPFSKSKNLDNQNTWTFYTDRFEIMPVFDNDLRLIWLRVWDLSLSDKEKIEFKNNLKAQNKNVNQNKIDELLSLKKVKPTDNWLIRMNEGDSIFSISNISEAAELLDNFIDSLIESTKTKKASSVFSKVKNTVMSFNKLNNKHNGFIETLEREELVDFIEQGTKLTGLVIEPGVDITEDYRQW